MSKIQFFFEEIEAIHIPEEELSKWLTFVSTTEGYTVNDLNYIICSDEHLYGINVQYLSHDYYTDVITFDNSDEKGHVEGDIFISLERISDNAQQQSITQLLELRRIMVHGLLHLVGYNDKTLHEKEVMTEKENAYLSLPQFKFDPI